MACIAGNSDYGRHVDDASASLTGHYRGNGVDEVECGLEVNVDDCIPLGLVHPEHQAVLGDAGVVDKDINPAEVCHDLAYDLVSLLEICCVGRISLDFVAESLKLLDSLLGRIVDHQVGECHISSFRSELESDRFSDSSRCARNKGGFSFQ